MAKAEIVTQQDSSEEPKNLFSFLKRFGLKLPVFNEDKKAPSKSVVKDEAEMAVGGDGEADNTKQRPNFVRFPNAHPIIPPPLDIELEESSGKTHNPVIIWQVGLVLFGILHFFTLRKARGGYFKLGFVLLELI